MALATAPEQGVIAPAGTWTVDAAHSRVGFSVKHMGVSTVRGEFRDFEGTLELGDDLASSRAHGVVMAASVDTNEAQRDEHLRSPDFFDAERHPELRFESRRIEALDEDTYRIAGDLTMNGVTAEIELQAEVGGTEVGIDGNDRIGLEVTGQLSRSEFGMKFNQALGSGNLVVSDKVRLALDIAAVRQG
jgi:polyisoprenoid-binding protein YceI